MVLFNVTKTDTVRVNDAFARTITLHKVFTDTVRIRDVRFFSPVGIIISEAISIREGIAEIKSLLRYLGLNLGRGIRVRQARDEAMTEV